MLPEKEPQRDHYRLREDQRRHRHGGPMRGLAVVSAWRSCHAPWLGQRRAFSPRSSQSVLSLCAAPPGSGCSRGGGAL
ncbi:hypothetical protein HMPREF9946_04157 [Acetobacteraceae bacterium AT-5844]|nr:hypothetical protein HMPREF9946_04157 [Acetobacteraceae bacterium AT-5844]